MAKKETVLIIPKEKIISKIFVLREEKVILDVHISEIYGVENRALKPSDCSNFKSNSPAETLTFSDDLKLGEHSLLSP